MGCKREDVEFEGFGGTRLRGWFYRPEQPGRHAGVVMAHGFSAVKEMALDRYAEVFCAGGLAVLVYDHRGLGASDGEPRQEINPFAQARDYRRALGWLAAQPEVDAARIGLWGSSYSGGEVIVVAACDRRVRAVVANVPLAGFEGADYGDTKARFAALKAALLDESGRGPADVAHARFGPLPVVRGEGSEDGPVVLDQPESAEWFLRVGGAAPNWFNSITLVNGFGGDAPWDPGVCVAHVAPTPLLLVVASEDRLAATSAALAAYERAGEPKQLTLLEGHHFVPYEGEAFERSSAAARDFFLRHLARA